MVVKRKCNTPVKLPPPHFLLPNASMHKGGVVTEFHFYSRQAALKHAWHGGPILRWTNIMLPTCVHTSNVLNNYSQIQLGMIIWTTCGDTMTLPGMY